LKGSPLCNLKARPRAKRIPALGLNEGPTHNGFPLCGLEQRPPRNGYRFWDGARISHFTHSRVAGWEEDPKRSGFPLCGWSEGPTLNGFLPRTLKGIPHAKRIPAFRVERGRRTKRISALRSHAKQIPSFGGGARTPYKTYYHLAGWKGHAARDALLLFGWSEGPAQNG
jgi:hypothetical protein